MSHSNLFRNQVNDNSKKNNNLARSRTEKPINFTPRIRKPNGSPQITLTVRTTRITESSQESNNHLRETLEETIHSKDPESPGDKPVKSTPGNQFFLALSHPESPWNKFKLSVPVHSSQSFPNTPKSDEKKISLLSEVYKFSSIENDEESDSHEDSSSSQSPRTGLLDTKRKIGLKRDMTVNPSKYLHPESQKNEETRNFKRGKKKRREGVWW